MIINFAGLKAHILELSMNMKRLFNWIGRGKRLEEKLDSLLNHLGTRSWEARVPSQSFQKTGLNKSNLDPESEKSGVIYMTAEHEKNLRDLADLQ